MTMLSPKERIGQLQDMFNKYGDFKVAIASMDSDGNYRWSKHVSVLECWQSDVGLWFLSKANNRTIQLCELVLDIDNNPSEEKLNSICSQLEALGITFKAYFTGSKGYHIHILDAGFLDLDVELIRKIKEVWIKRFDCDILKSSSKTMIALENVPHWKTGKPKILVRANL